MLTSLIIDDEQRASKLLRASIEKLIPEITSIHVANDAMSGLNCIEKLKPQLIFLDIEMPHMNGFEMLNQIRHWNFDVIFTTAFNQYAIQAIRYSALDYLLKPIDGKELRNAFERYLAHTQLNLSKTVFYESLMHNLRSKGKDEFKLTLCSSEGSIFVDVKEIIRCEAESNYTVFHFVNRKKWVSAKTLKEYNEILGDRGFIRVHKSHLVNKLFVAKLKENHIYLTDHTEIEIARRRSSEVKEQLGF